MVKVRKDDEKVLGKLASRVRAVKGETSRSEVVGLSLRFADSKLDEFVSTVLKDFEGEPVLELLRNPSKGPRTDARRAEEYLYG